MNFGCGPDVREGWFNVDRDRHEGMQYQADILDGFPCIPDDHFDYIVANHSINGIRFDDLSRAFATLRRVLKPTGRIRILVPDAWFGMLGTNSVPISEELEPTQDGRWLRYLFWHGDSRCAFTWKSLIADLDRYGFKEPRLEKFGRSEYGPEGITDLDAREDEGQLIVEAWKELPSWLQGSA